MRLPIDTNVFLEIILDQEKAEQSKTLLENTKDHEFFISDYSLHSIGLLLFRRKQYDIFKKFLIDMVSNAGMKVIGLSAENMQGVVNAAHEFNLDFDDAYQYTVSQKNDLTIISFDSDFERTKRGSKSPQELI